MMKLRHVPIAALASGMFLLAGCGGINSGVEAVAPAPQDQLTSVVSDSGQYTLYRASGFGLGNDPHVEPIWTVSATQGQKIGFQWVTDPAHRYDNNGAFHLVAFAGGDSRDLGAFQKQDLKYVWGSAHADVAGYFHGKNAHDNMLLYTMQ